MKTVKAWTKAIKEDMEKEGLYKPTFDKSIHILAEILFERDRIHKQYIDEGAQPLVEYQSDRGSTNRRPNPLLKQWQELNNTALSYIKELGLSPAGARKAKGALLTESDNFFESWINTLENAAEE